MSDDKPPSLLNPVRGFGIIVVTCPICGHEDEHRSMDNISTSATPDKPHLFGCGHKTLFDGTVVH